MFLENSGRTLEKTNDEQLDNANNRTPKIFDMLATGCGTLGESGGSEWREVSRMRCAAVVAATAAAAPECEREQEQPLYSVRGEVTQWVFAAAALPAPNQTEHFALVRPRRYWHCLQGN